MIERTVASNLCSGCGLCAGMFSVAAAEMEIDASGFARPRQLRSLESAEVAEFSVACPGLRIEHVERNSSFHQLWGPVLRSQTGHAVDLATRYKGSSGGALSALAIYLLESEKVQGVLHTVAANDEPFKNLAQISRTREEVLRGAGSRYAPASPLSALQGCLDAPGKFAFLGKPCDVAALRTLGRSRPDVADKFRYHLSFMCAGTPGLEGTYAVVKAMGIDPAEVVRFRYRGNGWPGAARAETRDGRHGEMDYEKSWGSILNRQLQFRCKICPDGTGEFADVTCADAWHGDEKGYPKFDEVDGRSLVLSRTEVGQRLVSEAVEAGYLKVSELGIDQVAVMQPYQAERKRVLAARLCGLRLAFGASPAFRNLGLISAARCGSWRSNARNFFGSWFRVIKAYIS